MTPERKIVSILKARPGLKPAKPKGTAFSLLEPIIDKKVKHSATQCHNQSERKGLFYIYSERRRDCSELFSSLFSGRQVSKITSTLV